MSVEYIPEELKKLNCWCVSTGAEDKAPRQLDGSYAYVDNPATWCSFDDCVRSGYPLVGFVFNKEVPYTGIDLDDHIKDPATPEQKKRFKKILRATGESYAERSISGRGAHIIVRAQAEHNFNRDHIEVFSSGKYLILTGDVLSQRQRIASKQHVVDALCNEYKNVVHKDLNNGDGVLSDEQLLTMAQAAQNKDKFNRLWKGAWEDEYPSRSEAHLALCSMLCYYTSSDAQVERLFLQSAFGSSEKAVRTFKYTVRRARSQEPPPVDTSVLIESVQSKPLAVDPEKILRKDEHKSEAPGVLGEIAEYIEHSSIKPVRAIGEAGARAFMSGLTGAAYNIEGTGLNTYQILLAKTGIGKSEAAHGIERIAAAIRLNMPSIDQRIGPANFASGPAILRTLEKQKCFVAILGEFGHALNVMCDPRAHSAEKTKQRVLLDLYARSGKNQVLRSSAYADSDKNTSVIMSPAVSLLGEGTPGTFFSDLDTTLIANGLIPRFSVIHYQGKRVPTNKAAHAPPDKALLRKIIRIAHRALELEQKKEVCDVSYSKEGRRILDAFDRQCDILINKTEAAIEAEMWNRSHLKALKLAALCAVSDDPDAPMIDDKLARWAVKEIVHETRSLLRVWMSDEYGTGEAKQEFELMKLMKAYNDVSYEARRTYGVPKMIADKKRLIPLSYLRRRTQRIGAFYRDRRGPTAALRDLMQILLMTDAVKQVPPNTVRERFGLRSDLFYLD